MDLTAQVINEVEFSMARRGYDPDQVDEFLEKVASKVEEANQREAALRERLAAAERKLAEGGQRAPAQPERAAAPAGPSPTEMTAAAEAELETLKRTLLLAQRTADAAVREAEEEARRIVTEAESGARAAHESAKAAVLQEISDLEALRGSLRVDVEALETAIGSQRMRLQASIADLARLLDEPDRLAPVDVPVLTGPATVTDAPVAVDGDGALEAAPADAPVFTAALDDDADDDAWARFSAPDDDVDLGPRTEPVLRLDKFDDGAGPADDDAYLTELRKAMLDDTGAPSAADVGLFDRPEDARGTRTARFGRRR
jgi:DivIVA domain-containing protein